MQTSTSGTTVLIIITTILLLLLAIFIVSMLFLYQKKQIGYHKMLNELKANYEKNLLKTKLEIQEQTFQDISREIHDNIGLSLTLAKLNLVTIDTADKTKSLQLLNSSIELIGKSITDLSDISRSLNSDIISDKGLIKTIELEVHKLKKTGTILIEHTVTGEPIFLDSQKELVILRILQEALNNILKHAAATTINIQLHYNESHLDMILKDNGVGFNENDIIKKKELFNMSGFKNMRSRAEMIGGNCIIESRSNEGTIIKVSIPFK